MISLGRLLVSAGLVLLACGAVVLLAERWNFPLGRLPGDIVWRGRNFTFSFPLVTCLLVSVLGSVLLWILNRRP